MKKIIGITGGIGVGKSTICKIFEILGIPVFYADNVAKNIVNTDIQLKENIIQLLGSEAYNQDGYNRKYVASRVFSDKELLAKLNQIIHPAVRTKSFEWALQHNNASFCLYEAAIMKSKEEDTFFDKIIVVSSPKNLRIERIKNRDARTESEILAIINNQTSEDNWNKIADYQIVNDEKQGLINQVIKLYGQLAQL